MEERPGPDGDIARDGVRVAGEGAVDDLGPAGDRKQAAVKVQDMVVQLDDLALAGDLAGVEMGRGLGSIFEGQHCVLLHQHVALDRVPVAQQIAFLDFGSPAVGVDSREPQGRFAFLDDAARSHDVVADHVVGGIPKPQGCIGIDQKARGQSLALAVLGRALNFEIHQGGLAGLDV